MNVLIPTMPDDTHAIYVHLAMQKKSHNSLLWYTADFPTLQTHSFSLKNNNIQWVAKTDGCEFALNAFDVVWHRRPRAPLLPDNIHEDDIKNSEKENRSFFQNFWHIIAPDALWINSSENARRANCKMLQLAIAMRVGFSIPETLMSNNPLDIKNFISNNGLNNTIYKTFSPLSWNLNDILHMVYTVTVTKESLPSDTVLRNTAGIFQKKIEKAFEIRVTYFGDYPVAVKLHSQKHVEGKSDWRAIPTHELLIEAYTLPDEIHKKCKEFMSAFGLLFGCFDFIVTPNNEYYFLEINEQGQFLWIEDLSPDIKMLDIFTSFLSNKTKNFQYIPDDNIISIADFEEEAVILQNKAIQEHRNPPSW